jgi:hypothetical protein
MRPQIGQPSYMKSNPHGVNLHVPQLASIEAALTRRMTMIQGPPGSMVILLFFFHFFIVVSLTHVHLHIHLIFILTHRQDDSCRSNRFCTPVSNNLDQCQAAACAFSNVVRDNLAEAMIRLD